MINPPMEPDNNPEIEPINHLEGAKLLYNTHNQVISELKARMWDLTKWAVLTNTALAGASYLTTLGKTESGKNSAIMFCALITIGSIIILASIVITLKKRRERLVFVYNAFGVHFIQLWGRNTNDYTRVANDMSVWLSMLLFIAASGILAYVVIISLPLAVQ
jgi:hypothetical protein